MARPRALQAVSWRRGPGFVFMRDARDPKEPAQVVLDGEGMLDAFARCVPGVERASMDPETDELVGQIVEADGRVMLLPSRMRRWPIPSNPI